MIKLTLALLMTLSQATHHPAVEWLRDGRDNEVKYVHYNLQNLTLRVEKRGYVSGDTYNIDELNVWYYPDSGYFPTSGIQWTISTNKIKLKII